MSISAWNPSLIVNDDLMFWSLGNLVIDICARSGLDPDMYDVGSLEGRVKGLLVSNNNNAVSVLATLAQNHLFDMANYSGLVHFIPRGGEPIKDVPLDDLIGQGNIDKRNREDSIAVPLTMHLEYFDIEGGLNTDLQTSERSIDSRAKEEKVIETTELMTSDEAARSIAITHKLAVEEQRGVFEFSLTRKHFDLVTADAIVIDGERMRITSVDIEGNSQKYKASFDRVSAYSSTVNGVQAVAPSAPPDKTIGISDVQIMDLPILYDTDDNLGFYIVAERTTPAWEGVAVEISIDGGESYIDRIDIRTDGAIGYLTAPLGIHPHWYQDERNTLELELVDKRDEIEQYTHRDIMNRRGLILVGNELMNYEVSNDVDGLGKWELSRLLRGRKGTDAVSHEIGERVVFLEYGLVQFIETSLFDVGRTYTIRITSFGTTDSIVKTFYYAGKSQIERAPVRLTAKKNGANMLVSWSGVGKLGGGGRVAMGQHFDGYRVTSNGITHDTNEQFITIPYSAGIVKVQQKNKLMGLGLASEITA